MNEPNAFKYVKFYNIISESLYDGFLVKHEEGNFYTIDPICYEWLQYTGNWHWLDVLEPRKFEYAYFPYIETNAPKGFIGTYAWLFEFPATDEHVKYLHNIANFFEWFALSKPMPLQEKLALCKSRTSYTLPSHVAQDVCEFITNYVQQHPDRLRFLLNGY